MKVRFLTSLLKPAQLLLILKVLSTSVLKRPILYDGAVKLKQESIKLGEVIPHIVPIPIVIPLKLFYISWEIRYSHEGSLIVNYMYMSPFLQKLTGERIPTQHW